MKYLEVDLWLHKFCNNLSCKYFSLFFYDKLIVNLNVLSPLIILDLTQYVSRTSPSDFSKF